MSDIFAHASPAAHVTEATEVSHTALNAAGIRILISDEEETRPAGDPAPLTTLIFDTTVAEPFISNTSSAVEVVFGAVTENVQLVLLPPFRFVPSEDAISSPPDALESFASTHVTVCVPFVDTVRNHRVEVEFDERSAMREEVACPFQLMFVKV